MLFSEDSPIDKWKITDLANVNPELRVAKGAQITLYIKPKQTNEYQADELHKVRHLVENIEKTLTENNMPIGNQPKSDIASPNWKYTSYRNEYRSDREGNVAKSGMMHDEPVYILLTK